MAAGRFCGWPQQVARGLANTPGQLIWVKAVTSRYSRLEVPPSRPERARRGDRSSAVTHLVDGCGRECMVRYLALLIVCVVAVLTQVGPSMAHGGEPASGFPDRGFVGATLTTSPVDGQDCAPGAACCTAMCAACYVPLPPQYGRPVIAPPKSQVLALRQACLRSIILGRDPPVPRNRIL